jgi:recombination protein RecT
MATELAILENQLKPLAPRLEMVLDKRVPVERLMQTIMISCERLPALLKCDRQSLFNSAMSAAVLGLEVDGVTGQAYLIPFAGKAQLVIGYKGFNTLAARSGITITGAVVREGDEFDYELGSSGYVRHKPLLNGAGRRIIGAWACATSNTRPAVHAVMGADELLAVKAKSPGAKRSDSPWNDPTIGYPAMCEKTVKRRLARSMPLNIMQLAARLDEAVDEQGMPARIDPERGVIVEGEIVESSPTPTSDQLLNSPRPSVDAAGSAASSPSTAPQLPPESDAADTFGTDELAAWNAQLAAAAERGTVSLVEEWSKIPKLAKSILSGSKDRVHKPRAAAVDAAKEKP